MFQEPRSYDDVIHRVEQSRFSYHSQTEEFRHLNANLQTFLDEMKTIDDDNRQLQQTIEQIRTEYLSQLEHHLIRLPEDFRYQSQRLTQAHHERYKSKSRARRFNLEREELKRRIHFVTTNEKEQLKQLTQLQKQQRSIDNQWRKLHDQMQNLLNTVENEKLLHRQAMSKVDQLQIQLEQTYLERSKTEFEIQALKEELQLMQTAREFLDEERETILATQTEANEFLLSRLNESIQHIRDDFQQLNQTQLQQLEIDYQQELQTIEEHLLGLNRDTTVNIDQQKTQQQLHNEHRLIQQEFNNVNLQYQTLLERVHTMEADLYSIRDDRMRQLISKDQELERTKIELQTLNEQLNHLAEYDRNLKFELTLYRGVLESEYRRKQQHNSSSRKTTLKSSCSTAVTSNNDLITDNSTLFPVDLDSNEPTQEKNSTIRNRVPSDYDSLGDSLPQGSDGNQQLKEIVAEVLATSDVQEEQVIPVVSSEPRFVPITPLLSQTTSNEGDSFPSIAEELQTVIDLLQSSSSRSSTSEDTVQEIRPSTDLFSVSPNSTDFNNEIAVVDQSTTETLHSSEQEPVIEDHSERNSSSIESTIATRVLPQTPTDDQTTPIASTLTETETTPVDTQPLTSVVPPIVQSSSTDDNPTTTNEEKPTSATSVQSVETEVAEDKVTADPIEVSTDVPKEFSRSSSAYDITSPPIKVEEAQKVSSSSEEIRRTEPISSPIVKTSQSNENLNESINPSPQPSSHDTSLTDVEEMSNLPIQKFPSKSLEEDQDPALAAIMQDLRYVFQEFANEDDLVEINDELPEKLLDRLEFRDHLIRTLFDSLLRKYLVQAAAQSNRRKTLDWIEFRDILFPIITGRYTERHIRTLFDLFDTSNDGHLSLQEIADLLEILQANDTIDLAQNIIDQYDTDHDGKLSADEFIEAIRKTDDINEHVLSEETEKTQWFSQSPVEFASKNVSIKVEEVTNKGIPLLAQIFKKFVTDSDRKSFDSRQENLVMEMSNEFVRTHSAISSEDLERLIRAFLASKSDKDQFVHWIEFRDLFVPIVHEGFYTTTNIQQWFELFDSSHVGTLNNDEILLFLRLLQISSADEILKKLTQTIERHREGDVSWTLDELLFALDNVDETSSCRQSITEQMQEIGLYDLDWLSSETFES